MMMPTTQYVILVVTIQMCKARITGLRGKERLTAQANFNRTDDSLTMQN